MPKCLRSICMALTVVLFAGGPVYAQSLGSASAFSVMTMGEIVLGGTVVNGGYVGAVNDVLAGGSSLSSDLIGSATSGTAISASNASIVSGQCVTGGGGVSLMTGSSCASEDTSGTNPLLTTYAQATSDVVAFSNAVAARPPTEAYGSILIPPGGNFTINTNVPDGTTVVSVYMLQLGGGLNVGGTLTINGGPDDYIAFNVFGNFFLFNGAKILLTGGIPASHVVFNVLCEGTSVEGTGSILYNGTIVAVGRRCDIGEATLNGQIFCRDEVDMNPPSTVNFVPLASLP